MRYPNGITKTFSKTPIGNRGMTLENEINDTNKY